MFGSLMPKIATGNNVKSPFLACQNATKKRGIRMVFVEHIFWPISIASEALVVLAYHTTVGPIFFRDAYKPNDRIGRLGVRLEQYLLC